MRTRGARVLALALAVLALAACGKKGPPVAPERRLPVPPTGLQGYIDLDAIVVNWTAPRTRVDNSPLKDLTSVTLYRHEQSDDGPIKPAMLSFGRVAGYDAIAPIRLASPAPATVQGDTVQWVDRRGLSLGRRYVYVVTATDSLGRSSAPSERLAVTFLPPPRAPRSVQATAGDAQVTLRWEPPTEMIDGSPAGGEIRYAVLRGSGAEGALALITPQPVTGTSYADTGLDNDAEYRYVLRSVRLDPRAAAAGPPSTPVAVSPADTTPPSAPANLAAVPSPGAVRLAWSPSPEPDIALYAVYRATATGGFVRVGATVPANTVYIDREVQSGGSYRYAVTALDRSRRPNESSRSNEVTVRVP